MGWLETFWQPYSNFETNLLALVLSDKSQYRQRIYQRSIHLEEPHEGPLLSSQEQWESVGRARHRAKQKQPNEEYKFRPHKALQRRQRCRQLNHQEKNPRSCNSCPLKLTFPS